MLRPIKKFWNAISTGWVVEYPGRDVDGPKDFFDVKDRGSQSKTPTENGAIGYRRVCEWEEVARREEEAREDAVLKWHAQMNQANVTQR
jgi:hypothetical protein